MANKPLPVYAEPFVSCDAIREPDASQLWGVEPTLRHPNWVGDGANVGQESRLETYMKQIP